MKTHLNLRPPREKGGIGFTAMLLILVSVFSLWLGSQVFPIYWERWLLKQAVNAVANEPKANERNAQETYSVLVKKLDVQNVRVAREDFELDASVKPHVLKVYFRKEVKMTELLTLSADEWVVRSVGRKSDAE